MSNEMANLSNSGAAASSNKDTIPVAAGKKGVPLVSAIKETIAELRNIEALWPLKVEADEENDVVLSVDGEAICSKLWDALGDLELRLNELSDGMSEYATNYEVADGLRQVREIIQKITIPEPLNPPTPTPHAIGAQPNSRVLTQLSQVDGHRDDVVYHNGVTWKAESLQNKVRAHTDYLNKRILELEKVQGTVSQAAIRLVDKKIEKAEDNYKNKQFALWAALTTLALTNVGTIAWLVYESLF